MTLLVDNAFYGRITGDDDAYGAGMADILSDAQKAVEEHCKRKLAYGTYTESVYLYRDGKVYPRNTPLEAMTDPAEITLQGDGAIVNWFIMVENIPWFFPGYPPQLTVSYRGGYQPYGTTDGPTAELPFKLARAICQVAYNIRHSSQMPNVPLGATSVHVGDVGYSGNFLEPSAAIDYRIAQTLAGFVKHPVRAWS